MRWSPLPLLELGVIAALTLLVAAAVPATLQPAAPRDAITVQNLAPADGARAPARALRLSAEVVGERDLQRVQLSVNGQEVEPQVNRRDARRWLVSYPLPEASGEQRIVLLARDVHGRQAQQSWRFQVDPTLSAPTIGELQPPDGGYAPASGARFRALVQSDAPLDTVTLQIDGTPQPTTVEPAGGERATVSARVDLKPGSHQATLTAVDRQGDRTITRWRVMVPDPREALAFEQTGKVITGGFRTFWETRGGLEIFGLPISDEVREDDLTVQYFERARFEYHLSKDGLLSEVRLGLLGAQVRRPDPRRAPLSVPNARYFEETGHSLVGPFRTFWEERGGLAIFGLPLTDEVREGGMTVQYFERARFELDPSSGAVLLGHLGREVYARRYGQATAGAGR